MASLSKRIAAFAAAMLFSGLAGAQGPDESPPERELAAAAITASRLPDPAGEAPPALSVVTARDIAARGAKTVADALLSVAGVGLSDDGPEGSRVSVTIRGSTTNQVLVLLDGLRLNDALSGLVDLSCIPLERVERIEVMRGGGSSLYGGDAVGGVVNIITRKAPSAFALSVENGGYLPAKRVSGFGFGKIQESADLADLIDSQKASFSWAPKLGDLALRLSGGLSRAANAYTFIDANGEKRERQNAASLGADASLGATWPLGLGDLSADLSGSYARKGVPGSESSPTLRAAESDSRLRAALGYSAESFLTDMLSLDANARVDYAGVDYADPDSSSGDGRHGTWTAAAEIVQRAYPSDGLTLAYGASLSFAASLSDAVGSRSRLAAGAFVEPAFSLGDLAIRPSLRFDYYSDFFANDPWGGLGAAVGATYKLSASDSLKFNISRAYRVPSFNDLYWPARAGAEGDPNLKPETAYEANAGFERRSGALFYRAAAYARYSRDVILWQPRDDGVWSPSNFGAALYPGIEQEIAARIGELCSVSASYSFLRGYVLSGGLGLADDKRLPMTPEHSLKATFSYDDGGFSCSATATYASLRYLKVANVAFLPAHFTMDAFARWKIPGGGAVYAAIDNLFGENYETIEGYPMPGARMRLGFELEY